MERKVTTIGVDKKFFDMVFEKERRAMQQKIGLGNLSQANFTKMIDGFKLKIPKQNFSQKINLKKRGKNVKA